MQNTTKTKARKRRLSMLRANEKPTPKNFSFVKEKQGSVSFFKIGDAIKCNFKSRVTGNTAFAYGRNFGRAYTNMIILYNMKYEGHGRKF